MENSIRIDKMLREDWEQVRDWNIITWEQDRSGKTKVL
jgi:hypothetical protein